MEQVTLEDLNETINDINSLYCKLKSQIGILHKYTEDGE
jgi:hypothetical protein